MNDTPTLTEKRDVIHSLRIEFSAAMLVVLGLEGCQFSPSSSVKLVDDESSVWFILRPDSTTDASKADMSLIHLSQDDHSAMGDLSNSRSQKRGSKNCGSNYSKSGIPRERTSPASQR
jgi:hypothetical protein